MRIEAVVAVPDILTSADEIPGTLTGHILMLVFVCFKMKHSEIHWMISTGIMVRRWIQIQVDRWAEKVLNGKTLNISDEQTYHQAPPQLPEKSSDRSKRVRNDPFQSQSDEINFCFCIIWREMLPLLSMINKTWF